MMERPLDEPIVHVAVQLPVTNGLLQKTEIGELNRLGLVPYQIGQTCSERTLRRMLSQTGFRVLDVRFVMHHPSILAVLLTRGLEKQASPATQMRFLRGLMALERLADWPTRTLTGHFVAVRAIKADA